MRTFTKKEIDEILLKHAEYLKTGDLKLNADLSNANFYCTGFNLGCGTLQIGACDEDLVYQLLYHAARLPACS